MSYSSRIDSPAHWVRDGAKWFLFRLSIYVAVAVISAGLFFVGVAVYAFLSAATMKPASDLLAPQAPLPLTPGVQPDGSAPARGPDENAPVLKFSKNNGNTQVMWSTSKGTLASATAYNYDNASNRWIPMSDHLTPLYYSSHGIRQ